MPTAVIHGVEDFDGSRVTVAQHPAGAVVSVSVLTPSGRESTAALVQSDDRRRIGEAVLGEPVLTRTELLSTLDVGSAAPPADHEQLVTLVGDVLRTLDRVSGERADAVREREEVGRRAYAAERRAERAEQALADLVEASQQLEAEVVVRRSDLPDAHRNPADPERIEVGERTYTTSGGWNADRHRAEGLERLAVAALLDREGAEEARQQAEDDALAEAVAAAIAARWGQPLQRHGATATALVRAIRAAGWTPPAPAEEQAP